MLFKDLYRKLSHVFKVVPLLGLTSIVACYDGDAEKKLNDNTRIERVDANRFNIIFDKGTASEWKYFDVDSIAILENSLPFYRHGLDPVLLFGRIEMNEEKKWFYIGGGTEDLKKGFGDWYNNEFHKYRLNEIDKDRTLYKNLMSARQMWQER